MNLPNAYDLIISVLCLLILINGYLLHSFGLVVASALFALVLAVAVESAFEYILKKKFTLSKSAMITGLIITSILPPGPYLPIAIAVIIAILSKKIITVRHVPVFNPAASGLFVAFLFSGGLGELWWAEYIQVAVLLGGLVVALRINKLPISLSYLITTAVINFLLMGSDAVMFLPLFPAFFMLTEPKTTPYKKENQVIFGVLAAVLLVILSIFSLPSPILLSLLILNIPVKFQLLVGR